MAEYLFRFDVEIKSCYSERWGSQGYCPFHYYAFKGGSHCSISKCKCLKSKRPDDCPLVKLPPHGDLIDRDNLAKQTKINICKTGDDYDDMWKAIFDAPTIIEASTSPAGFCNTEGCSNSKPDMSKALNHICPYYQGVCSLDENILCYRQHHYEMCDKFIEVSKEKKWNIRV